MNADMRRELDQLLSALCDGTLTEAEHARLEQLLRADEACQRYYLEYVDMHARLLVHPGLGGAVPAAVEEPAETPAVAVPLQPRGKTPSVLRYGAVAAVTLAASLLVQVYWWHPRDVDDRRSQPPAVPTAKTAAPAGEPVATLVQTADCAWQDAREPLRDGARLQPGTLQLQKGLARIRFDNGSELLVQGPAELRLDGGDEATLLRGKVVFHSDVTAGPFGLHTPVATLVDLGTEYGVAVGPDGEEVHVFEGDVQRVARTVAVEADAEYLQAGEACRSGPASFASRRARCDATRFVRHLAAPPAPAGAAGLLAYEGFDYPTPDALTAAKANGGRGWTNPWTVTVARPLEWCDQKRLPLNVEESLTRPGAAVPSVGGRFDHAGFGVYYRQMAAPLRLDTDGVYYISCLFRRAGPAGHPFNTVALMLRPNEDDAAAANGNEPHKEHHHAHEHGREHGHAHGHGVNGARPNLWNRLIVGAGGSNQVFSRVGPHCARASLPIVSGVSYLLVAKVVASRSSYDQVFVRVYGPREPLGTEEPATWTMVSPAFHSDLVFHWLGVHVNSKNRQMIDEIRVGTSWPAVAGPWLNVPAAAAKNGSR